MKTLTGLQRDILDIIDGREALSGSALTAELEAYYEQVISAGRLYPTVAALVEQGLVEQWSLDGRTNRYLLSEQGQQALAAHIEWKAQSIVSR